MHDRSLPHLALDTHNMNSQSTTVYLQKGYLTVAEAVRPGAALSACAAVRFRVDSPNRRVDLHVVPSPWRPQLCVPFITMSAPRLIHSQMLRSYSTDANAV